MRSRVAVALGRSVLVVVLLGLAVGQPQMGDDLGAHASFQWAAALNPGDAELLFLAASAAYALADFDTAWEQSIRAIQAGYDRRAFNSMFKGMRRYSRQPADLEVRIKAPKVIVEANEADQAGKVGGVETCSDDGREELALALRRALAGAGGADPGDVGRGVGTTACRLVRRAPRRVSSDRFATLIRGGILVLPDTELGLRPVAGDLLMRGDRIMRVGEVGDPPSGARVIYAGGCVAIPGLVQAHTHLNHTLFRGTTDLGEAERWLGDRIWPLESAHTPQSVRAATRLAVAEMLRGGVTAVQAMEAPRHADIVLEVLAESGMVGVCGKTLIDDPAAVPHPLAQPTDVALSEAIDLAESWDGAVDGRIRVALMPFSALACTGACLSELGSLAASGRWRLHLHAVTRPDDIARMQARTDLRDLLWLAEAALVDVQAPHCAPGLDPLWTLVHCSGAADVRAVWLAGKQVVSEGRLTLWDEEEVVGQARREAKGLLQRAGMA